MTPDARQPRPAVAPVAADEPAAPAAPDPTTPPKRNLPYLAAHGFTAGIAGTVVNHAARGLGRVPAGGVLLVSNHASNLDPLMIGYRLPRPVSFLAKDSLFRVPLLGPFLRATHTIPVDRSAGGAASIRAIAEKISAGYAAAIFPEGTRTRDGSVGEFKPGFLSIVKKARCPVVPVGIAGTFEVWPAGRTLPRPGRVRVVFGEPLAPEAVLGGDRGAGVAVIREAVVAAFEEAADWRAG